MGGIVGEEGMVEGGVTGAGGVSVGEGTVGKGTGGVVSAGAPVVQPDISTIPTSRMGRRVFILFFRPPNL